MSKVCLFVGGPCDGVRQEADVTMRTILARPVRLAAPFVGGAEIMQGTLSTYRQHLFTTHTPKKEFYIYAPEAWTADEVIGALIEKYPAAP